MQFRIIIFERTLHVAKLNIYNSCIYYYLKYYNHLKFFSLFLFNHQIFCFLVAILLNFAKRNKLKIKCSQKDPKG